MPTATCIPVDEDETINFLNSTVAMFERLAMQEQKRREKKHEPPAKLRSDSQDEYISTFSKGSR